MKPILLTLSLLLCLTASLAQTTPDTYVEVLYFHGKQRCVTCKAIEACTREVIDEQFTAQVKEGKVRFRAVDISTPDGEKLAARDHKASLCPGPRPDKREVLPLLSDRNSGERTAPVYL